MKCWSVEKLIKKNIIFKRHKKFPTSARGSYKSGCFQLKLFLCSDIIGRGKLLLDGICPYIRYSLSFAYNLDNKLVRIEIFSQSVGR